MPSRLQPMPWSRLCVHCPLFTDDGSLLVAPRSLRPRIISKPWKWSSWGQQRCLVVRELGRDWKVRLGSVMPAATLGSPGLRIARGEEGHGRTTRAALGPRPIQHDGWFHGARDG